MQLVGGTPGGRGQSSLGTEGGGPGVAGSRAMRRGRIISVPGLLAATSVHNPIADVRHTEVAVGILPSEAPTGPGWPLQRP